MLCTWEGLSYCIFDTQLNVYVALKHIPYPSPIKDYSDLNKAIDKVIKAELILQLPYKKVRCIYPTQCCTLIPQEWAQPEQFKSQLEINHSLNDLDEIHSFPVKEIDANCVFAVPGPLSAKLCEKMGQVTYIHQSIPLIHNVTQWQMEHSGIFFAVNIHSQFIDIALCTQETIKLYNTFSANSAQDLVYFLMLIAQEYKLERQQINVVVSGRIDDYTEELQNFFGCLCRVKISNTYYSLELQVDIHPYFDLLLSLEQCVS
ncbi:hypothetical protein FACS189456_6790 [Bacteroidia bacterium]|nr:hypothetical protein FACS189456_6790 [Bacteroidia bacterium]